MNRKITAGLMPLLLIWLLTLPAAAQSTIEAAQADAQAQDQQAQSVRRLQQIRLVLEARREQLRELLGKLETADALERARIETQIAALRQNVGELSQSFERIAAGGVSLKNLAESEKVKLDWRDELLQVARPILNSLKEATAKPRKIEELRSSIELSRQQLEISARALASIAELQKRELPDEVASGLRELHAAWSERNADLERSIEVSSTELANLEIEEVEILDSLGAALHDFGTGRGLTLLLALLTGLIVWFVLRGLRALVSYRGATTEYQGRAARLRLLLYGYQLLSVLLVVMAVLSVFYLRGDLLLLSLALIAIIMLVLGAWRVLPTYIQEARLLLNAGSAREGERVIFNGLPFRIASLNLQSQLRNPELEGSIRLPLGLLGQLTSRPFTNEAWFPSSNGDYLLLPDGGFAQVLQQTVEVVRLKVMGSVLQYASADFLQLGARNLTREGFGVAVVFGIDYEHQGISLDTVPERFKSAIAAAFEASSYAADFVDLLVEFKQAGASSLDYIIFVNMQGAAAGSYFGVGRLIQQTCVDVCNQEGWGIPFTQVTIHQAASED